MWKKAVRRGAAIWFLSTTFALNAFAVEPARKITCKEAVNLAEKFIAENGYTASNPGSKPIIRGLLMSPGSTEAQVRSLRYNTLEPKAYGVINSAKRGRGWTVVFQYSKEVRSKYGLQDGKKSIEQCDVGRAVTMDEFGQEIKVQHVDIFLKATQRRL